MRQRAPFALLGVCARASPPRILGGFISRAWNCHANAFLLASPLSARRRVRASLRTFRGRARATQFRMEIRALVDNLTRIPFCVRVFRPPSVRDHRAGEGAAGGKGVRERIARIPCEFQRVAISKRKAGAPANPPRTKPFLYHPVIGMSIAAARARAQPTPHFPLDTCPRERVTSRLLPASLAAPSSSSIRATHRRPRVRRRVVALFLPLARQRARVCTCHTPPLEIESRGCARARAAEFRSALNPAAPVLTSRPLRADTLCTPLFGI